MTHHSHKIRSPRHRHTTRVPRTTFVTAKKRKRDLRRGENNLRKQERIEERRERIEKRGERIADRGERIEDKRERERERERQLRRRERIEETRKGIEERRYGIEEQREKIQEWGRFHSLNMHPSWKTKKEKKKQTLKWIIFIWFSTCNPKQEYYYVKGGMSSRVVALFRTKLSGRPPLRRLESLTIGKQSPSLRPVNFSKGWVSSREREAW